MAADMGTNDADKVREYYSNVRGDVIALIEGRGLDVLELGCARGLLGAELKRTGVARRVTGIEYNHAVAEEARKDLDEVLTGDLDSMALTFPPASFDLIVAADVLEHLRDPWGVLGRLRLTLKPGGRVVASVPNVKYIRVLFDLIFRDRFTYRSFGILDSTHLRFFTRRTAVKLFVAAGYHVTGASFRKSPHWKSRMLDVVTLGLLRSFFSEQVLLVASKPD